MAPNKNTLTAIAYTRVRRAIAAVIIVAVVTPPVPVYAVSSWNPTLVVNTESFQQIDAGDGSTSVDLRFGASTSTLKLLASGVFQFNKSLSVVGGISGSYLTIDHQANISGALTVKSTVSGANLTFMGATDSYILGKTGIGKSVPKVQLEVAGTMSGKRLSLTSDQAVSTGALYVRQQALATGALIKVDQSGRAVLALDSHGDLPASTHLLFGYRGAFDTNLFRSAASTLKTSGNFIAQESLSGSSFFGAGLGDCNNSTTSKLIYNPSTGKFNCATDQTGGGTGGSNWSNTGSLQGAFDNRYVNTSGDTMTGALNVTGGLTVSELSTPGVPTVTPQVPGATAWGYKITALSANGETLPSIEGTTSAGAAALSVVSFNHVTWTPVTGAVSYKVYRTTAGGTPSSTGLLGTATSASYDDTGAAASGNLPGANTTGYAGIRTTTPKATLDVVGTVSGSALVVSGASAFSGAVTALRNMTVKGIFSGASLVVSGASSFSGAALFRTNLTAKGTISGKYLVVSGASSFSGAALFRTTVTAKSGLSGASLFGAGLGDCNNSTTSKLIYNPSTGKFNCATDQDTTTPAWSNTGSLQGAFDRRYVNQHGDTMTGSLRIRSASGTTVPNLTVYGGMSGYFLRTSGSADIHGPLAVSGSLRADGDFTINDDRTASADAVLTFGNSTANQTLKFIHATQKFEFSKDLRVLGTISGSALRVDGNADVHGILSASGAVHFDSNLSINDDRSAGDTTLTFGNATLNQDLKFLDTEQRFQFSANLNVLGSISGKSLAVSGASSFSGAALFRTTVTAKSGLSGASLFGAGLGDCNNSTTSKLIYNPSTGKFNCATDQTGGGTGGGGMSYTDVHNIFVDQAGDTMTGALNIRPLAGSTTVGLNVAATTSGRSLFISGTGSSRAPILMTDTNDDAVGINTDTPYSNAEVTLSGSMLLYRQDDSITPPGNTMQVYAKKISGRMMLKGLSPSGVSYPFQPSFFQNIISMINVNQTTTLNAFAVAITTTTTISHVLDQRIGYLANFATTAVAGNTSGVMSAQATVYRGSIAGSNGFFWNCRMALVNTGSIRVFAGLNDQTTVANMLASDNTAGNRAGFSFSTNRSDTTWKVTFKDGTTENLIDTGISAVNAAPTLYDLYLYSPPFNSPLFGTVWWRIDNLVTGATAEGSTSSNLPTATTALRTGFGVAAIAATARNVRLQRIYLEQDQ